MFSGVSVVVSIGLCCCFVLDGLVFSLLVVVCA